MRQITVCFPPVPEKETELECCDVAEMWLRVGWKTMLGVCVQSIKSMFYFMSVHNKVI